MKFFSKIEKGTPGIKIACLVVISSLFPVILFSQSANEKLYLVFEETGVKVAMRDGVRLSTNIFRPDSIGKFPVLLLRTPYGKNEKGRQGEYFYAQRGYVVVIQDARGRYDSEGIFDAFQAEANDGFDTQEWIGRQAWCNGSIGTFGSSYEGFTQWLPAAKQSRYLKTMFTSKTFSNLYKEVYKGGAFRILRFCPWSFGMTRQKNVEPSFIPNIEDSLYRLIPLAGQDQVLGWKIPFLKDWLSHPQYDEYWSRTSVKDYRSIKASVFNMGGWFDSFLSGTLDNFIHMTDAGIETGIRSRQRLVMGPWIHGNEDRKTGDLDFGEEAAIESRELELRWFESQLKGIDNGILKEPPVKIFVMGANKWRDENEWPLARTKYKKFYFYSKGHANTLIGNGSLDTLHPATGTTDQYVYDPNNPVPTSGNLQPVDQRKIEERKDVLVFSTGVLKKDIEVTGPVTVTLYAASTATNTDFTAKLVDVYPDGRAIGIREGIIRASFRNSDSAPLNIEPGKVYEYHIDLWSTSNLFKAGHKIRVEISSSDFPMFDRNLNVPGIPALSAQVIKAIQTIYHDKIYPSCIILPVIE
ncbi:MAG: CocE/NonD family hydrolase [Ginsengibacter sp.]